MMRITICGDVSPICVNDYVKRQDIETLFHDVPEVFRDSDSVIVNLECALTESDTPIEKMGPNLKVTPLCAEVLKAVGVTDVCLSNNHIFDYGVQGVKDTLQALKEAKLNYTGFGDNYEDSRKDLILEKDGITVAIVNVCEHEYCYALENRMGARAFDVFDTMADIRRAKEKNDYVIVVYHGGKEQCVYPSPRLRKQCQAMVDNGADLVLCQHSHCMGCYEIHEKGQILYGQGNFHFVDRHPEHPHWQNGLIVQVTITDKLEVTYIPVRAIIHGIELAKGKEKEQIIELLQRQSDDLHNGKWLDGWRQFCEANKELYYGMIGRAYGDNSTSRDEEYFAHFLYCEAHHDVWQEICKLSWETRTDISGNE